MRVWEYGGVGVRERKVHNEGVLKPIGRGDAATRRHGGKSKHTRMRSSFRTRRLATAKLKAKTGVVSRNPGLNNGFHKGGDYLPQSTRRDAEEGLNLGEGEPKFLLLSFRAE